MSRDGKSRLLLLISSFAAARGFSPGENQVQQQKDNKPKQYIHLIFNNIIFIARITLIGLCHLIARVALVLAIFLILILFFQILVLFFDLLDFDLFSFQLLLKGI